MGHSVRIHHLATRKVLLPDRRALLSGTGSGASRWRSSSWGGSSRAEADPCSRRRPGRTPRSPPGSQPPRATTSTPRGRPTAAGWPGWRGSGRRRRRWKATRCRFRSRHHSRTGRNTPRGVPPSPSRLFARTPPRPSVTGKACGPAVSQPRMRVPDAARTWIALRLERCILALHARSRWLLRIESIARGACAFSPECSTSRNWGNPPRGISDVECPQDPDRR